MLLTFAAQPSALAHSQTALVLQLMKSAYPALAYNEIIIAPSSNPGDDDPLSEIDGRSVSTRELERSLLAGRADVAVHSFKDLPEENTPGLVVAAIPERQTAYDVLLSTEGQTLSALPGGARVGTNSQRRAAQLLAQRPDLMVLPVSGEADVRVKQLLNDEYDALVLAQADLIRLGLQEHISEVFSLEVMLPGPGQGALAVQCRAEDIETLELLAAIHDRATSAAVTAELAFLSGLGGRCSMPVAAFAEEHNDTIILTGAVLSPDGKQSIRLSAAGRDPARLGDRLAGLVIERGAIELFKAGV